MKNTIQTLWSNISGLLLNIQRADDEMTSGGCAASKHRQELEPLHLVSINTITNDHH
jgi:hypothetical protein